MQSLSQSVTHSLTRAHEDKPKLPPTNLPYSTVQYLHYSSGYPPSPLLLPIQQSVAYSSRSECRRRRRRCCGCCTPTLLPPPPVLLLLLREKVTRTVSADEPSKQSKSRATLEHFLRLHSYTALYRAVVVHNAVPVHNILPQGAS